MAAIKKWAAPEKTLAAVRTAAEGGDLAAQCVLGVCYQFGVKGAPNDEALAAAWFGRAAAGNVAQAQFGLATIHERGEGGLAVNDAEAARLYRLAADAGLADAQFNLGNGYRDGRGVRKDEAEAARL